MSEKEIYDDIFKHIAYILDDVSKLEDSEQQKQNNDKYTLQCFEAIKNDLKGIKSFFKAREFIIDNPERFMNEK